MLTIITALLIIFIFSFFVAFFVVGFKKRITCPVCQFKLKAINNSVKCPKCRSKLFKQPNGEYNIRE